MTETFFSPVDTWWVGNGRTGLSVFPKTKKVPLRIFFYFIDKKCSTEQYIGRGARGKGNVKSRIYWCLPNKLSFRPKYLAKNWQNWQEKIDKIYTPEVLLLLWIFEAEGGSRVSKYNSPAQPSQCIKIIRIMKVLCVWKEAASLPSLVSVKREGNVYVSSEAATTQLSRVLLYIKLPRKNAVGVGLH